MGLLSKRSGRDALARFLALRARRATKMFAVEEALLSGRFHVYALRRLSAFGLARAWGTILHVVELTWLVEVFSAKAFVASLALQNATLILDAGWFGALDSNRAIADFASANMPWLM